MTKLRKSARRCPHCMCCGLENNNGDLLCLAHSNRQQDGKGMGHKSRDEFGAIVCDTCHSLIDGRTGLHMSREQRQDMHYRAHLRTRKWWIKEGLIPLETTLENMKGTA